MVVCLFVYRYAPASLNFAGCSPSLHWTKSDDHLLAIGRRRRRRRRAWSSAQSAVASWRLMHKYAH